eukprot:scaffold1.g5520.t1
MARAVLDGVLTDDECAQLIALARCMGTRGYRPGVSAVHAAQVAAAAPELLLPLMVARERVRAAAEEALGTDLLVEFTGLVSWRPGADIGWHHDANAPYLVQRTHTAVAYLNTAGADFQGGAFLFAAGVAPVVEPAAGRVLAYAALEEHAVRPVTAGERFTLTLWFTQDPSFSEDTKLLAQLAGAPTVPPGLPDTMFQLPEDGADLRLCRLAMMGFGLLSGGGELLRVAPPEPGDEGAEHPAGASLRLVVHPRVLDGLAAAVAGVAAAALEQDQQCAALRERFQQAYTEWARVGAVFEP